MQQSQSDIGCTICYQSKKDILEQNCNYDVCSMCDKMFCHDCFKEWMLQQIKGKHFRHFHKIELKCQQEKCENKYAMEDLQDILDPSRFADLDEALTQKMVRAGDQYLNCPNSSCGNYGFLEDICCPSNIECTECQTSWRLKCQPQNKFNLSQLFSWESIYDSNTYSNLYKVIFAQMCPSCKVMIIRSEGCKFMECGKCQFQFCWFCLSEFYTEYHYYESFCPLRIVPIYGLVGILTFFLTIKIYYAFPVISWIFSWIFMALITESFAFALTVFFIAIYRKSSTIYGIWKKILAQQSTHSLRGSAARLKKNKEDLKVQSLVALALVSASVGVLGIVRELSFYKIPGLDSSVYQNVPIHLVIYCGSKLYVWYKKVDKRLVQQHQQENQALNRENQDLVENQAVNQDTDERLDHIQSEDEIEEDLQMIEEIDHDHQD
eukprot:403375228